MICENVLAQRPAPQANVYIDKALNTASHIFIQQIAIRSPLHFKVFHRSSKYFMIDHHGVLESISTDQLKSDHLVTEDEECSNATEH
ncbi:hypothetical protein E2C01_069035 [Portunus trituberculatus]|uniref:Uncharacterized protein n=1 Tax=Portunus trituberculatus TaxID=210409 RepID=A0A5B7I1R1_PORTR|nr:hypothetical protein [Portunus trituberculatus]